MSAPARSFLLLLMLALTLAGSAGCVAPAVARDGDALREAMDGFVAALLEGNAAALSAYFPRDGEWTLLSTIGGPEARSRHAGAATRDALRDATGVYEALLDSAGLGDTLRDHARQAESRPWGRTGPAEFAPDEALVEPGRVFVRWREEAGRWVVDTVGVPFS